MTEPAKPNALLNELVTFIQNDIPGLDDGEYQLTVSQKVNDNQGNPISDDSLTNSYTFAVLGDRFRLSQPGQTVYTVFPSDNGSGEYSTVLPHVVFTKSTLPWARYPTSKKPTPSDGEDVPTWLTVLLFDEDDVEMYPSLILARTNATVGDLFPPVAYAQSTLGDNYSYFDDAKDTTQLEPGQAAGDPIQVLDIPLKLFWSVAPTIADLDLMAHVRKVSLVAKPTIPGVSDVGEPVGTFSIVFGNRLPQAQKKTCAYLVSLEELEPVLPTDDGGPPAGKTFDDSRFLRLAVLKSWTFFSTGESATFVDQLLELNGRPAGSETDATNTNVRLSYSGDNTVVKNALSMGYVPLNNDLRTGGKTVSWYRGPLVPYSITKPRISFPIASADQAMVFDPTTGMLDVSYAAAWTIGRMIALQDAAFSTPFYNWKRGLAQQVVNSIEEDIIQEKFSVVLDAGDTPHALAESPDTPASKALIHKLMQSLSPK